MQSTTGKKQPRWILLGIAALFLLIGASWNWNFREVPRQAQVLTMAQLLLAFFLAVFLWILFFSGWRPVTRWRVLVYTLLGIALLAVNLKITGVSGDLVPIVIWRWQKKPSSDPVAAVSSTTAVSLPTREPGDYPQYLGPARNGVVSNISLADWSGIRPKVKWQRSVGPAWSGFAVAGKYAVTQEQRGEEEVLVVYDLFTGTPLWSAAEKGHYQTTIAGEGPRSTPTIEGDRVFALGATGILRCHDLATGQKIWSTNLTLGIKTPDWGVSAAPLVTSSNLVVSVAGPAERSLRMINPQTGALIWQAGCDSASYSSPVAMKLAGEDQVVSFHSSRICGHAAVDGTVRWSYPWPPTHPHVTMPLQAGPDRLLVSSGYGTGSELLQVEKNQAEWKVSRVWKSNRLKSKFSNLILHQESIYGLDDGMMACLDLLSGELKWKDGRFGHGQLILAGRFLLLMAENGEVILVDPVPSGLKVVDRIQVLKGKTWNPPALAGNYLLVRNAQEAVCLELPMGAAEPQPNSERRN